MTQRLRTVVIAALVAPLALSPALSGRAPAQDVPLPDTDPPQTTITEKVQTRMRFHKDGRDGESYAKVRFRFTSDEPESTFECKLDKQAWEPCTKPARYRVDLGEHRFKVRATDPADNTDPTAAKRKFVIKKADAGDSPCTRQDCPGHGDGPSLEPRR